MGFERAPVVDQACLVVVQLSSSSFYEILAPFLWFCASFQPCITTSSPKCDTSLQNGWNTAPAPRTSPWGSRRPDLTLFINLYPILSLEEQICLCQAWASIKYATLTLNWWHGHSWYLRWLTKRSRTWLRMRKAFIFELKPKKVDVAKMRSSKFPGIKSIPSVFHSFEEYQMTTHPRCPSFSNPTQPKSKVGWTRTGK